MSKNSLALTNAPKYDVLSLTVKHPARPWEGRTEWVETHQVAVDPQVKDLIPLLDKKSQQALFRMMIAGEELKGNPFAVSHEGSNERKPVPERVQRIRHQMALPAELPEEPPLQINPPPTYARRLEQEGYRLVKHDFQGNGFYDAVALGLQRLLPRHPDCPQEILGFKDYLCNKVKNTQQDRDKIHAFLTWELLDIIIRQHKNHVAHYLNQLPQAMRGAFSDFYHDYHRVEQKDKVLDMMHEWIGKIGVDLYIDGIREGFAFSGITEAGILSEMYGLPITIHRIQQSRQGAPVLIGDEKALPGKRLHLHHYANRFSLMLSPEQEPIVID